MAARRTFGRVLSLAILVAAEVAAVGALTVAFAPVAYGQFFDDRYPFLERRRYRRHYEPPPQEERQQDFSRAPAAEERKADAPPVTTRILVFGDSLADWLAYGLEEALAETPEIGIIRKHKAFSGLIKYDDKPDSPAWPQVAREAIAAEKPNAIIMLLGIADRKTIREEPKEQKPDEAKKQDPAKPGEQKPGEQAQQSEQPSIAAPEREDRARKSAGGGSYEYRSEEWEEAYSRKIDEMIATLKTANVPVLWVGLPSIRGKRSTSDALYLNEFYRARAEAAGIMYVDVWDGFVDENGKYTTSGPDLEGQIRRLRTADGVHFTKSGARKLAHYVERELRRVLANPVPVALTTPEPSVPQQPAAPAKPSKPAERPLAGPVFLLTKNTEDTDELLGGGAARRAAGDPVATSVLVKGEATVASAGRADDHSWPPRVPNTVFNEPLPPSGAPILMVKPPPPPKPPVQTAEQASPPRVAGQQVLQRQVQPQYPQPPGYRGGWRAPPPAYYGPPRGFFGLFR